LEVDVRVGGQEIRRQVDGGNWWCVDLEVAKEDAGDPLVDQDAAVLRIIAEFDDVEVAVLSLNEVGLRAAAHLADKTLCRDGHR
jgi:hypothetical protein